METMSTTLVWNTPPPPLPLADGTNIVSIGTLIFRLKLRRNWHVKSWRIRSGSIASLFYYLLVKIDWKTSDLCTYCTNISRKYTYTIHTRASFSKKVFQGHNELFLKLNSKKIKNLASLNCEYIFAWMRQSCVEVSIKLHILNYVYHAELERRKFALNVQKRIKFFQWPEKGPFCISWLNSKTLCSTWFQFEKKNNLEYIYLCIFYIFCIL